LTGPLLSWNRLPAIERVPGGLNVSLNPRLAAGLFAIALSSALASMAQEPPPPPPPSTPPAEGTPAAAPAPATAEELQQAKDAFKKGTWSEASDAAKRVLAIDPKQLEALYIAGSSSRRLGDLESAATYLKTLVDASPKFPLSHFELAFVEFLQADALGKTNAADAAKARYAEAADEFGKELENNPTHAASLSSRAIALARAGKIDAAVPAYEAWIAASPQKNDPVVSLASAHAAVGHSSEAMAALDRLPDKSPKAVFDGVMAAAGVFVARRDWAAAVPFLEKAVSTDPASTRALALLTEACARAGQMDDAVTHLEALLKMEPTPEEAEAVGEAIKATVGNGKIAPSVRGVEPPATLRIPTPRYPKGQDMSIQTEVLILTQVLKTGAIGKTVLVPNRIWKDIRASGFETEAVDAIRRGKFAVGTKDGQAADLWIVVAVKFSKQ
jgi:tetratricopeptide (TPR) repeat protein